MITKILNVTPEIAKIYLENNKGNRKPRLKVVKYLSDCIKNGEWILTHQGVAIDTDGNLIDGQHRLMAVVDSGISVQMSVTTGASPASFKVVDNGTPRTYSELTGIEGRVANICTTFMRYANGSRGKISPESVLKMYESEFGRCAEKVVMSLPKNISNITSAPMRTAAAYHLYRSGSTYGIDQLKSLVGGDFENLSGPSRSYMKRLLSGNVLGSYSGGSKQARLFDVGVFILDERNEHKSNIVSLKQSERDFIVNVANEIMTS